MSLQGETNEDWTIQYFSIHRHSEALEVGSTLVDQKLAVTASDSVAVQPMFIY